MLAGQCEYSLPVFVVAGVDAAAESAVRLNQQMLAFAVGTGFGARRTPRPDCATSQRYDLLQPGNLQGHSRSILRWPEAHPAEAALVLFAALDVVTFRHAEEFQHQGFKFVVNLGY